MPETQNRRRGAAALARRPPLLQALVPRGPNRVATHRLSMDRAWDAPTGQAAQVAKLKRRACFSFS